MSKSGTVKFFNNNKGFGFIVQNDGAEDIFIHRNQIADGQDLVEGDAVRYDEAWDDMKGKANAVNVSGGKGGGACFNCGEMGHRASECPNAGSGKSQGKSG